MREIAGNTAAWLAADRKRLEVIVTSAEEAVEAEQGGADCLEIVQALNQGGLTPTVETVRSITAASKLPVRVMIREANSMEVGSSEELRRLRLDAAAMASLGIDGFVLGFIRNRAVDCEALTSILSAAPQVSVTFHRAFEHVQSQTDALAALQAFPQVDRILVRVSELNKGFDLATIKRWQQSVAPHIRFILGIGLERQLLRAVRNESSLTEVHVGRSARDPESVSGAVSSLKVSALKSALL